MRAHNNLIKKHLKAFIPGEIPHVIKLEREIAVKIVNSHPTASEPRPMMPNVFNVAGANIRQPAAFNADIIVRINLGSV